MAYDLSLRTAPSEQPMRHLAPKVAEDISQHPIIGPLCEVTPLDSAPGQIDVMCLDEQLLESDNAENEFHEFCKRRGLAPNKDSAEAAAAFLDSISGANLVSVKLPRDEEDAKRVYSAMVQYAKTHDLVLFDPQHGQDIRLEDPGELPPFWG